MQPDQSHSQVDYIHDAIKLGSTYTIDPLAKRAVVLYYNLATLLKNKFSNNTSEMQPLSQQDHAYLKHRLGGLETDYHAIWSDDALDPEITLSRLKYELYELSSLLMLSMIDPHQIHSVENFAVALKSFYFGLRAARWIHGSNSEDRNARSELRRMVVEDNESPKKIIDDFLGKYERVSALATQYLLNHVRERIVANNGFLTLGEAMMSYYIKPEHLSDNISPKFFNRLIAKLLDPSLRISRTNLLLIRMGGSKLILDESFTRDTKTLEYGGDKLLNFDYRLSVGLTNLEWRNVPLFTIDATLQYKRPNVTVSVHELLEQSDFKVKTEENLHVNRNDVTDRVMAKIVYDVRAGRPLDKDIQLYLEGPFNEDELNPCLKSAQDELVKYKVMILQASKLLGLKQETITELEQYLSTDLKQLAMNPAILKGNIENFEKTLSQSLSPLAQTNTPIDDAIQSRLALARNESTPYEIHRDRLQLWELNYKEYTKAKSQLYYLEKIRNDLWCVGPCREESELNNLISDLHGIIFSCSQSLKELEATLHEQSALVAQVYFRVQDPVFREPKIEELEPDFPPSLPDNLKTLDLHSSDPYQLFDEGKLLQDYAANYHTIYQNKMGQAVEMFKRVANDWSDETESEIKEKTIPELMGLAAQLRQHRPIVQRLNALTEPSTPFEQPQETAVTGSAPDYAANINTYLVVAQYVFGCVNKLYDRFVHGDLKQSKKGSTQNQFTGYLYEVAGNSVQQAAPVKSIAAGNQAKI